MRGEGLNRTVTALTTVSGKPPPTAVCLPLVQFDIDVRALAQYYWDGIGRIKKGIKVAPLFERLPYSQREGEWQEGETPVPRNDPHLFIYESNLVFQVCKLLTVSASTLSRYIPGGCQTP